MKRSRSASSYLNEVLKILTKNFPGMEMELEKSMYVEGRTPRKARFYKVDIFIPLIRLAIEVDGEHHFKPIDYEKNPAKAQSKFERRQMLDRLKDYYAQLNGWHMLRLSPDEIDEEYIVSFINKLLELEVEK